MPTRASATLKDVQTPTVSDALRRNARPAALLGMFIGAATFAVLWMLTPRGAGAADVTLITKLELSALTGVTSLMVGAAWIVLTTLFGGAPARRRSKISASSKKRKDPLLAALPDEPLLREIPELHTTPALETATVSTSPLEGGASNGGAPPASVMYDEIGMLAARLGANRTSGGGHRTLITGEAEPIAPFGEALELARLLADTGMQTILIDWSPSGNGVAGAAGLAMKAGCNELLNRAARFDDTIQRLPGTRAHAIASGESVLDRTSGFDPDFLNLVLDALEEAYDHIVVVGRHDEARALFECIEGRFDTGITVVSPDGNERVQHHDRAFLGFEVADIDILRLRRSEQAKSPLSNRIARATRPRELAAQGE